MSARLREDVVRHVDGQADEPEPRGVAKAREGARRECGEATGVKPPDGRSRALAVLIRFDAYERWGSFPRSPTERQRVAAGSAAPVR